MKQKKKTTSLMWGSGVSLQSRGVTIEGLKGAGKDHAIFASLMQLAIVLLSAFGSLFTFIGMFSVRYYPAVMVSVVAIISVACLILFSFPKKVVRIAMLAAAVLYVIAVFLLRDPLLKGFTYVKDDVFRGIYEAMLWPPKELPYTWNASMKFNTTLIIAMVAILLTFAVSYFTIRSINFLCLFLVTFPFFVVGAAYGAVPPHWAFALLLGGWTSCFAMYVATRVKKRKKPKVKKNKKAKNTNSLVDQEPVIEKPKSHLVAGVGMVVALITVGAFFLTNVLLSTGGFTRTQNLKRLRMQIKDATANITDLITGKDHDGSLKEGRLYELGDRVIKNRPYLTVDIPIMEKQVYLKGYIGSKYNGKQWEELSDYTKYDSLFSDFDKANMYPQQFGGELLNDLSKKDENVASTAKTVTISNLRRKKNYSFTVYNSLLGADYTYNLDLTSKPKNKRKYSYTSYINNTNTFKMNLADLYYQKSFVSLWEQYGEFVNKEYLALPDGMDDVKKVVSKIKVTAQSNLEIADYVRDYLANNLKEKQNNSNVKYSLLTDELPEGKDFVKHFLFEQKKGYSAHYATAAALLLRAAGIPTRYVEGYLLTEETYENGIQLQSGNYKMVLTDENAHAWIELYEPNYGWVPVEVTPGFYTGKLESFVDKPISDEPPTDQPDDDGYVVDPDAEDYILVPPPIKPATPKEPTSYERFMAQLRKILPKVISGAIAAVVGTVAVLFLLYEFLIFIRRYLISKRKRVFTVGTTSQRTKKIYKYFNRLLKFEGLGNKKHLPYLEYAAEVSEKSAYLDQQTTLRVMELFLQSKFSDEAITEEEVAFMIEFVTNYRKSLFKDLHGRRKWTFKYVKYLG